MSMRRRIFFGLVKVLTPVMPLLLRFPLAWRLRAAFFKSGDHEKWLRRYGPEWDAPSAPPALPVALLCDLRGASAEEKEALSAALARQKSPPFSITLVDEYTNAAQVAEAAALWPEALVLFLDAKVQPLPLLTARYAQAAAAFPEARLWYADEIRPEGLFFKPAWDPFYQAETNYVGRCFALGGELAAALGEKIIAEGNAGIFSAAAERLPEGRVGHIPVPLCRAEAPPAMAKKPEPAPPENPPLSVIIPFRDRLDLLKPCLETLTFTDYPQWECVLVDNGSREPGLLEYLKTLPAERFRLVRRDDPFNFSALVNAGAAAATGEILVLLNNDITVIEPGWLREMARLAWRPEVGCVGAKLLYPNGLIQHGGILCGEGLPLSGEAAPAHAHSGWPGDSPGYFGLLSSVRTVSAVTAAALAVRRELYMELGGFDERLAVAMNDVDFCLRVRQKGYSCLWTPEARLVHHESATRRMDLADPAKMERLQGEWRLMRERWGLLLQSDFWYNPNLSNESSYETADPPRDRPPRLMSVSGRGFSGNL